MEDKTQTIKPLKKADYDSAVRTATALLDKFNAIEEWSENDKENAARLKTIIAMLKALAPLKKKTKPRIKVFDREKDMEIVRRFIERVKNEGF